MPKGLAWDHPHFQRYGRPWQGDVSNRHSRGRLVLGEEDDTGPGLKEAEEEGERRIQTKKKRHNSDWHTPFYNNSCDHPTFRDTVIFINSTQNLFA